MKAVLVLLCVAVASGQRFGGSFQRGGFRGFRGGPPAGSFRSGPPTGSFRGGPPAGFRSQTAAPASNTGGTVDDTNGGSEYHYSWRHDNNKKYTHGQAVSYCNRLAGNWDPISIEKSEEDSYVNRVIKGGQPHYPKYLFSDRLEYLWTGGSKSGGSFKWPNAALTYNNWSHTGGARSSQPDNRERGGENCLAILNNFYRDGVKWHDVACHHKKPIICERKA